MGFPVKIAYEKSRVILTVFGEWTLEKIKWKWESNAGWHYNISENNFQFSDEGRRKFENREVKAFNGMTEKEHWQWISEIPRISVKKFLSKQKKTILKS